MTNKVINFPTGKKRLANRSKKMRRYKGPKNKINLDSFVTGFGFGVIMSKIFGDKTKW